MELHKHLRPNDPVIIVLAPSALQRWFSAPLDAIRQRGAGAAGPDGSLALDEMLTEVRIGMRTGIRYDESQER